MRLRTILTLLFITSLVIATFGLSCRSNQAITYSTLAPAAKGELVEHNHYSLSYIEQHEGAEWVYYILTPTKAAGGVKRKDNFRADPKVSTGSAQLSDYKRSGYDRGHLCPAGDMGFDDLAMSESFYMSNMSPQSPSLNRGTWKNLETELRELARDGKTLHIVTGPIFRDNIGTIGKGKVTIPGYYYKAVYCPSEQWMVAYIMPNRKLNHDFDHYVVSVDSIETVTNIDLYPQLEDGIESRLESTSKQPF